MWDSMALVYFVKHGPRLLVWLFSKLLALLLFNRFVLWFGGGVPGKQYALIRKDGIPIEHYIGRTVDGKRQCLSRQTQLLPLCYRQLVWTVQQHRLLFTTHTQPCSLLLGWPCALLLNVYQQV